jgi:hypothetical protein
MGIARVEAETAPAQAPVAHPSPQVPPTATTARSSKADFGVSKEHRLAELTAWLRTDPAMTNAEAGSYDPNELFVEIRGLTPSEIQQNLIPFLSANRTLINNLCSVGFIGMTTGDGQGYNADLWSDAKCGNN